MFGPSNLPPTSPGVLYIVYTVALVLGLPGLIGLSRAIWFMATSKLALATVDSEPHMAGGGPSYASSIVSFDVSFQLPDGTRQRGLITWITGGNERLLGVITGQGVLVRYNRRNPSDVRLAGQSVGSIGPSLLLLALAIGIVLLFR